MSSSIDDFDLNFEDFVSRVNSDLIGKITNVASRGAQMLQKLGGKMGELSDEGRELVKHAQSLSEQIAAHYEERDFSKAIIAIRGIADEANKYFDKHEPWKLVKTDPAATIQILSGILNLFRIMTVYLKPVLPGYAAKVERLFQEDPYTWTSAQQILEFHEISPYEHLAKRVEMAQVQGMLDEAKALAAASMEKAAPAGGEAALNLAPTIGIEDFQKIDLRVVKIIDA
jgi:methionyl-tRNA synthetase